MNTSTSRLPECPYCGRIMSNREAAEQGSCNDCYEDLGLNYDPDAHQDAVQALLDAANERLQRQAHHPTGDAGPYSL